MLKVIGLDVKSLFRMYIWGVVNFYMYLLILIIPLLSIIIVALLGRFLTRMFIGAISTCCIAVMVILSIFFFWEVCVCGVAVNIYLYQWVSIVEIPVYFGLTFDVLSVTMLLTISLISFAVHLFSLEYMFEDPSFKRFMLYITCFTFFMIIMVTSDNLIQFFLGWEGIGVMSYLLINFWYDRPEANRSAMKAIFLNKIGDVGFYFVICFFILFYRSVDFGVIYNLTEGRDDVSFEYSAVAWSKFDLISFFIILAAVGKSSQLALHMWLPEAMEGPTPVSALLHSATMVTAGVFLLVRMAPILESSAAAHSALVWIGILTSFISSFIACNQTDFKKIVAYSTTGQLALMFIACGFSQYGLAMQHLFNHAFFKASLFLIAGSLIHHVSSRQDVRDFGNVLSYMPFTFSMFMLSTISLIGIPATSGFVSKEYILESSFVGSGYEDIVGILVSISICLTAFYSIQLLWLAFGGYNWNSHFVIQESRSPIFYSILFLCTSGVVTGFLFQEVFNNVFIYREIIPNDAGGFRAVEMSPDLAWLLLLICRCFLCFSQVLFVCISTTFLERWLLSFILFLVPSTRCSLKNFILISLFFTSFFLYFLGFFTRVYLNFTIDLWRRCEVRDFWLGSFL